jgi:hypothetical protein
MQNWLKLGDYNAICSKCNCEKPSSEFYLNSNKKPSKHCKTCHLESGRNWRKNNPDKMLSLAKKFRDSHYDLCLERTREWRKANKKYDAHRAKLYRMRKAQQVPPWANIEAIKQVYLTCPDGYHVDHIIPLKGKLVSGLHVETNLQHLPAKENMQKRNHYAELVEIRGL